MRGLRGSVLHAPGGVPPEQGAERGTPQTSRKEGKRRSDHEREVERAAYQSDASEARTNSFRWFRGGM